MRRRAETACPGECPEVFDQVGWLTPRGDDGPLLCSRLLQLQRAVLSPDSDVPDELLYGRAGFLYALLYVNREMGRDAVDEATIAKVASPHPASASGTAAQGGSLGQLVLG